MQCFVGGSGRENLMFFFAKNSQDARREVKLVIVFVHVILQDPYDIVDFASFGWLAKNQNSFWREILCMYS
jgi:hypothetical protein